MSRQEWASFGYPCEQAIPGGDWCENLNIFVPVVSNAWYREDCYECENCMPQEYCSADIDTDFGDDFEECQGLINHN